MGEVVTLEIPAETARRAREVAALTHRRLEDVLVEWLEHAVSEPPIESLPDDQLLTLCALQMEAAQQEALSDLLAGNREGVLNETERERLDDLMQHYRHGLVRKARALKAAVERGLRPPLH
jgi:hypothetical protein